MDPRDLLVIARQVAAANTPAASRTAITRAYYAVFNVAWDLLVTLGFPIPRGHGGHEAVRDRLRFCAVDRVAHAGRLLGRLHTVRVKADYWMRDPEPEHPATVAQWLTRAEAMLQALDAVTTDTAARERMTRAILAWEATRSSR